MTTHITLSVAHAPQSHGVEHMGVSEYEASRRITARVAEMLHQKGIACSLIDVGGLWPAKAYSWVKSEKCSQVDRIDAQVEKSVAVELHMQRGRGVAVLHWHRSREGARMARTVQDYLEQGLNTTRHWHGTIPCPNADYWPESPQYCPFFIEGTRPPALMIELGSILRGEWWLTHVEEVAASVAGALEKAIQ